MAPFPSRAVARVTTTYVHEGSFFFVPFDETYYQAMAGILERRFQDWQSQGC